MSSIPTKLQELILAVGENAKSACWEVRSNVWAVNHKTLEKISAHLGISFDPPVPLEVGPEFVALCVTGRLGDVSEWSIGEASKSTSHNKYYCAMAEKRAKDRVILKLIGLHGDAYSEEEADDFKENVDQYLIAHMNAARENFDEVVGIKTAIANEEWETAADLWDDVNEDTRNDLWRATTKGGIWTIEERKHMDKEGVISKIIRDRKKARTEEAA